MTQRIPLDKITPDPGQPRKTFRKRELDELAASIQANGLLQPIVVRPGPAGCYIIIAGERRWRAHRLLRERGAPLQFRSIACVVDSNPVEEVSIRVAQLVENIQRDDMPVLEEADALIELRDKYGLTEDQIAARLGLAPFRVRWRLQLQNLAPDVRKLVAGEHLDKQQAMEIARLDRHADQRRIVQMINRRQLIGWKSVRNAVEAIIGKTTPIDLFGDGAPIATSKEVAAVRGMETRIESVIRAVNGGWREGECVIAAKVSPDRAAHMADKLAALRGTITTMERELRNVAAQAKIAMAG